MPGDDDQPIRLFHTSLRDFLTVKSRSGDLFINPPVRNICIAIDCLKVLGIPPVGDIFSGPVEEYACRNWCHHFHQGFAEGWDNTHSSLYDSLMSCLMHFVSQSLDPWINTLVFNIELRNTLDVVHSVVLMLLEVSTSSSSCCKIKLM